MQSPFASGDSASPVRVPASPTMAARAVPLFRGPTRKADSRHRPGDAVRPAEGDRTHGRAFKEIRASV